MSVYVEMPSSVEGKRAPFYLAAEEYIAHNLPADDYLFTWQIGPTVVMGRHQVAHLEVDLDFCRAEGIDVIRRKSGGGCIFADYNNIMVSRVTGSGPIEPIF
ncbi:MAG: biotin/lipoate A/B protein ligase family protein, partial [Alloprevotella sp.]